MMKRMKMKAALAAVALVCGAAAASAEWRASTNTAGLPLKSYPALVVDCGQDYLRQKDGSPRLGSIFRSQAVDFVCDTNGLWDFQSGRFLTGLTQDVDSDGLTDDDMVHYLPFSTTVRIHPALPWYDERAASARFYGGIAFAQGDRREMPSLAENGLNDETVIPRLAPRDNWTLFHEEWDVDSPYRFHAVWLWKKENFLADGSIGRVYFDTNSTLSIYLQRYWMGFDGGRWLVQDGSQYYLSEATFYGVGAPANGAQHVLRPTQTRWAPYNPQAPFDIVWPLNTNSFASHAFTNVQSAGWYLFKDTFIPAYTGFKWYAFETKAVVERPDRPSLSVSMVATQSVAQGIPAFYVARCETPYLLWKDVFRRARSNTFVLERGSTFDRDGDMGSMDLDDEPHGLEEPVTDVTVPDIMVWCNVLSREEGFTPCYYTDATFTNVFREVLTPPHLPPATGVVVYVNWGADGYRLPTSDEWTLAAGGTPVTSGLPVHSNTVAVNADSPDANGLYHIHDNVREMVWIWSNSYEIASAGNPVVLGGDYRQGSAADYGASGFRLVRRETGLPAPPIRQNTACALMAINPVSTPVLAQAPAPVMTSLTGSTVQMADREVSFALWRQIRNWAATNGYAFDSDGDMGSMDWWGFADIQPAQTHVSSEPVTDITAYDAMIWCNALSEKSGLTPVYYTSTNYTEVRRTAFRFRPLMRLDFEVGTVATNIYYQPVYRLASANGYRLMEYSEFTNAAAASRTQFTGFTSASQVSNRVWVLETAGGTTRPAGTSEVATNGFYDLLGNVMEWGVSETTASMQDCFGSAFLDPARLLTSTTTTKSVPRGWGYPDLGFRVVRKP